MSNDEAERYVYRCLAKMLEHDLERGAAYLTENLLARDEAAVARAVRKIAKALHDKSRIV